ncbi:MAG: hypothetical protein V4508_10775 [Pseudomonadota bacterium]
MNRFTLIISTTLTLATLCLPAQAASAPAACTAVVKDKLTAGAMKAMAKVTMA